MKKTILALAVLAAGVSASAQEASKSALAVTLDVTYVSDYVFRGLRLADASVQPSVEASYGDFYAGLWHSDAISDGPANFSGSETDLYAGYNLSINETFSADLGVTRYTYNGGSQGDTTEVYAGLKADVLLSPSVYYYYDFDLDVSSYIASIGHSIAVTKLGVSLDFSATFGYIQIPGDNEDYCYWGAGVAVPYQLSETATLTGAVNYTSLDRDNLLASPDQDQVVFSVGLAIGF
ncbi:MAG: hypothetical protein K0R17_469 [Rariglobus sp.]|jgi:uncharacterized protein (TIGR02001 family)|nr:hypothetical protein [Rariglobus sp.]